MHFQCEDLKERWPEFIYRELSEPEQSLFVKHLEDCSSCRAEEGEWREILLQFDSIASRDGSMEAPPELVYRVKRQVRLDEDWSRQLSQRVSRWMMGAAAACVLIGGCLWTTIPQGIGSPVDLGVASQTVNSPLQKNVLQSIYNQETLKFYHEQGILERKTDPSSRLADARCLEDSVTKKMKDRSL